MPGNPELMISSVYSDRPISLLPPTSAWSPFRSARRLTVVSRPRRSESVIGRILRTSMRPAPECRCGSCRPSAGAAEPVSRNGPRGTPSSTARRTASQSAGTRCHSSSKTGPSPVEHPPGIRLGDLPLCGSVQTNDRRRAPLGGRGLTDTLRALQGERWQSAQQLVQLVVDTPAPVALHGAYATKRQTFTLPLVAPSAIPSGSLLSYRLTDSPQCPDRTLKTTACARPGAM